MKNMSKKIYIIKADGEKEVFDSRKLKDSLKRSGVDDETIKRVIEKIESELVNGMTTKQIYKKAYSMLVKKERISAARYSVRRAILDLGPNGFPFEDFIGEIYRAKNYSVEVGKTIKGFCVLHEIDVFAENDNERILAEIKFHNNVGIKSDLKTSLYVRARFDDLDKGGYLNQKNTGKKQRRMLITNTKFSSRAVQYANCAGLELLGWDYPRKGSLQDLIEETGLHPLTCLTTLAKKEKQNLLNNGIVLCKDLKSGGSEILKSMGLPENKVNNIMVEVDSLCK